VISGVKPGDFLQDAGVSAAGQRIGVCALVAALAGCGGGFAVDPFCGKIAAP
jgi:hypothetical protein